MIRRIILRYQLQRGYARQAIVRQARAEAARKGHIAAAHRAYADDVLVKAMGR